jgi:replicative DNA helicase
MSHPNDDRLLNKGLPHNTDAERFVLGAILLELENFEKAAEQLTQADFNADRHKRIWMAMDAVHKRGEPVERVSVASELARQDQLEGVGGLTYLTSLDDGLPQIFPMDNYIRMLKEKTFLRNLVRAGYSIVERALVGAETAEDIVTGVVGQLTHLSDEYIAAGRRGLTLAKDLIDNFPGGPEVFIDYSRRPKGVQTGFYKLDRMTGGLRGGDVAIAAGRPSMGKTALALDIARHVVTHPDDPRTVGIFSLEMSDTALVERLICSMGNVPNQEFYRGSLPKDKRAKILNAALRLNNASLFIDDSASNLLGMTIKAKALQRLHGLGLLIIDYLQLMSVQSDGSIGGRRAENRNQELGQIMRGLKKLAKDLGIPVLLLSQLSRAPEQRPGDHRPQLSDLRDSGSIEQDADLVMFVYREEVYKRDRPDLKGKARLILAKQRNGPIGDVPLRFEHDMATFQNPTPGDMDEPDGGDLAGAD